MLQMQIYANLHPAELSRSVIEQAGGRLADCAIDWVSPIAAEIPGEEGYREFLDEAYLRQLGLASHVDALAEFWPRSGPRWDALGIANGPGAPTYLIVEAKSYPGEMTSKCTAKAQASKDLIARSLADAQRHYGVDSAIDWHKPYYQYANRLAHVWFMTERCGLRALLVNLCFVDDHWTSPAGLATSRDSWEVALGQVRRTLGFDEGSIPDAIDVFLPALPDRDRLPTHRGANPTSDVLRHPN